MSASKEQAAGLSSSADTELDAESVREYLKDHNDFLQRNPDLLDYLQIPHASGSAVSLVEKQVSVLRERNIDMRHRLKALTANARENDKLYEQTRAMVLKLLDADSVAAIYRAFMEAMKKDFQADYACMILFGDGAAGQGYRTESRDSARAEIGPLLNSRKAVCGALRREEFNYLFPATGKPKPLADAHQINQGGSAAIMPLADNGEQIGLIAVGSADANRYHSTMGTLFLSHIADVILRLLPRFSASET